MSEHDDEPVRRLRAVSPDQVRETAEGVLPGLPRIGALDALLREVDGLRLALETDLSLAASAVEAGAPEVARDIIDSEIQGLRAFERRSLGHLSDLAFEPVEPVHRHWWTHIPAAPFVAAAALVGFLVAIPHPSGSGAITASTVSASESLNQITRLAASGQTSEMRDAAITLHNQLEALVAQAKTDPEAARQGLLLLSAEREVIAQSGDSQALTDVLAASNHLSNLIFQALPVSVRATTPRVPTPAGTIPTSAPTSRPAAQSSPSPTAKPTPTTPSPTTTPSSRPTSSSQPSPSPTKTTVLPPDPTIGG